MLRLNLMSPPVNRTWRAQRTEGKWKMADKPSHVTGSLLTIGDEILLGGHTKRKRQAYCRRTARRGFLLDRMITVGDIEDDIIENLGHASRGPISSLLPEGLDLPTTTGPAPPFPGLWEDPLSATATTPGGYGSAWPNWASSGRGKSKGWPSCPRGR